MGRRMHAEASRQQSALSAVPSMVQTLFYRQGFVMARTRTSSCTMLSPRPKPP
jgi:hypothetical protein